MEKPHFQDELHALKTGMFIGMLMKAGIPVDIDTDDEGNYRQPLRIRYTFPGDIEPIEFQVEVKP